jgi:hypothetical protein
MPRQPTLDQWTDIALRRVLKFLERIDVEETMTLRGELRDLLKTRRARAIRNRKLGLMQ